MTLTLEQSSNKERYEAAPTSEIVNIIRTAMSAGCIRPSHVYDAVDELICRIEAAAKCELNANSKSAQFEFCNAAKLREAVVLALSLLDLKEGVPYKTVSQKDIDFMKAALAEPPRQCDVGTAEEQMKRQHDTMCNTTKACPDPDWSCRKCFAKWAQMPYKEGDAN